MEASWRIVLPSPCILSLKNLSAACRPLCFSSGTRALRSDMQTTCKVCALLVGQAVAHGCQVAMHALPKESPCCLRSRLHSMATPSWSCLPSPGKCPLVCNFEFPLSCSALVDAIMSHDNSGYHASCRAIVRPVDLPLAGFPPFPTMEFTSTERHPVGTGRAI